MIDVKKIVDGLLEIKKQYSSMKNDEIIKIMQLKILMEIRAKL